MKTAGDDKGVTVAGGALAREQFAAYAREQIRTAEQLLAGHRAADRESCTCSRPLPCPQARSLAASRQHYLHQISLLERTQLLPVVTPPATSDRRHHRRRSVLVQLVRLWKRPRRGDV